MIFNEIYSAYYNTVAKIIAAVIAGSPDEKSINKVAACTFGYDHSFEAPSYNAADADTKAMAKGNFPRSAY